MGETVVECKGLTKTYTQGGSTVVALDSLSLEIPSGELLCLMGPSGSGKSTLIHLLGGLIEADSGHVYIGDTDITSLSLSDAARFRRRHVGVIFQFFNLIPSLTVAENVALPLLFERHSLIHLEDRIDSLLEALGIGGRRDHSPNELSGGEMQRVAIARALIIEPKVILADEPTGNLDVQNSNEILSLLRKATIDRGVSTVLATHNLDATTYASRVITLRDGRIDKDTVQ